MKILKQSKKKLAGILFPALIGTCLLLPKLVLAVVTTTSKDPAIISCVNFVNKFGGAFDWMKESYCTASGLALFVIKTLINFSGVVAVMFLIVGGFFYLTSGGSEEQTEKGKKILINSIIGLVVIMLAYALVYIIGNLLTAPQ